MMSVVHLCNGVLGLGVADTGTVLVACGSTSWLPVPEVVALPSDDIGSLLCRR